MSDLEKLMRDRLVAKASADKRWYEITNGDGSNGNTATLRIYGEISAWWGVDAEQLAADLALITADSIEVQINSPGGSIFEGIAIYNALRTHAAHITTRVDGVAASIASVIAQAGDKRVMLSGSQMMIHQATGVAIGNADEVRQFADLLDRQNDNIANIYASHSGKDAAEFLALLNTGADTWMSADEAVEMGLADEVVEPEKKTPANKAPTPAPVATGLQFDVAQLEDLLERAQTQVDALTEALASAPKPSPAGEREETEAATVTVNREAATRLLASLTLTKENS